MSLIHMSMNIMQLVGTVVAVCTLEWLDPSVHGQMPTGLLSVLKGFLTMYAFEIPWLVKP